jgi:hypothetical protein
MLGRLLDTFVAAQLRAELAASSHDPRLYHLREEQGRREVDLLIETASGQVIGIEIKAAATINAAWPAWDPWATAVGLKPELVAKRSRSALETPPRAPGSHA